MGINKDCMSYGDKARLWYYRNLSRMLLWLLGGLVWRSAHFKAVEIRGKIQNAKNRVRKSLSKSLT